MPRAGPLPNHWTSGRITPENPATVIRPIAAFDLAFCRALFHEDRNAMFAPLGLNEQMLSVMLDQQFRAQQISYLQDHPDAEAFIIEHEGMAVGRVILDLTRPPAALTLRLIDIAILQAAGGRGIGTDVINCIGRAAHTSGATHIVLTVLQTNERARRLYERLGFVATNEGSHIKMVKPLP